ncbi:MAG: hypothetical protein IJ524_05385 [Bacteroidales bacterium]|nr:hypothetical protein [Bacteroidales bacterium]
MAFDNIWEKEEQQALTKRLQREYPAWQRRRRMGRRAVAAVAVVLVAGISIFNFQFSIPRGYDSVACNRSTFPASHWAEEAGRILTIQTI